MHSGGRKKAARLISSVGFYIFQQGMTMKKWVAKRILLKSHDCFYNALVYIVDPFINKIRQNHPDIKWYCSRKAENDWSKPSIRIYLCVYEEKESEILSDLDEILNKEKDKIGWIGLYDNLDPITPDPQKTNLLQIQTACEIALRLMVRHPCINKRQNTNVFIEELTSELKSFYNSMQGSSLAQQDILEALHFVANNLGADDNSIYHLASLS